MPPTFTQANRPLSATTPLGKDVLLLTEFSGEEEISQLFSFELEMLAEKSKTIAFDQLLGADIGVELQGVDGKKRHFHGICSRVSQGDTDEYFTSYTLTVVPKFWLLTRGSRCRVFQNVSVPDILKTVLTGLNVEWKLNGTYEPRNYCVQYRESDFEFASRLMEDEGIFYFFKHATGSHTMVVGDTTMAHPDVPEGASFKYEHAEGGNRVDERVLTLEKEQEIRAGKVTLWDHSFEMPEKTLEASEPIAESVAVGKATHKLKVGGNAQLEIYDYPGTYAARFDGITKSGGEQAGELSKISSDATRTAKLRMQEEAAPGIEVSGTATCMRFTAGHRFTLTGHGPGDGAYVLTSVTHRIAAPSAFVTSSEDEEFEPYTNEFTCIPAALPFRPECTTPEAIVQGCQTAFVVGPAGEEIFTDKYGRVRVQFNWDRDGKDDGSATCWVRVGSHWAGKQWGAIHIPRVGDEVIVDFLEGDPDQPIIVGSVYNANQMPPYALPDNRTQSGLKSRSTPHGSEENFNELRFEDKKDEEEIYFHAEKNFTRIVENNDVLRVGFEKADMGDQTIEIRNDRTETVQKGNETVTIEEGKRTITVKRGDDLHKVEEGNRTVEVDKGDDTHKLQYGHRIVEIGMGNDTLTIKSGNRTTKLDMGKCSTEAMQGIELKVGENSILIDQTGITIKGLTIKLDASVQLTAKGTLAEVSASGILQVKGAMTMIG